MKLKPIKVELFKSETTLSEIYQSTGFKYAFLSSDFKQCHPWVKCRDFLNDAVRNQVTARNDHIYGFQYIPGTNPPIDLEKMRMLVKKDLKKGTEENIDEQMLSALRMIICFERHGKVRPLTKLETTEHDKNTYVFTGSSEWVASPFMISLYTFLIRLGSRNIKFKTRKELNEEFKRISEMTPIYGDNDVTYMKAVYPYISSIIMHRELLKLVRADGTKLFDGLSIDAFHNYTGIVSLCKPANILELRKLSEKIVKEEGMTIGNSK